jgi:hypothetical protein
VSHSQPRFKPGDHPDDHRFLFEGHSHLLTDAEALAWRNLLVSKKVKASDDPTTKRLVAARWMENRSDATELLREGEVAFYQKVFKRILASSPSGLNVCPRCGSLCRTSRACLCPHCAHSWYEKRKGAEPVATANPDSAR